MKAMVVNSDKRGPALIAGTIPEPRPGEGEMLIRVRAAGVTPSELAWYPTTHTKDGGVRTGAVPGHEFSGVVEALGKGVSEFSVGDEVYGMNDWFADGAIAEFCLAPPQAMALKPKSLTHELAATVPIGALTAWQGLLDRAKLHAGERVLIHGAAGAVGLFAVQLAHLHGADVIGTASAANADFVKQLGANEIIDYKTSRFENEVTNVDIVFDAVGGDTVDRSWAVLKSDGRMVTIAADGEATTDQRVKDAFFIVEPSQKQLMEVGKLLDAGTLKAFVGAVVRLEQASLAYDGTVRRSASGKVVVSLAA